MVVLNRIAYIRKLLQFGAKVTATVSSNPESMVQTVCVFVNPGVHCDPLAQSCAAMVLDILETANRTSHIAEKGHKNSLGESEVVFYITRDS